MGVCDAITFRNQVYFPSIDSLWGPEFPEATEVEKVFPSPNKFCSKETMIEFNGKLIYAENLNDLLSKQKLNFHLFLVPSAAPANLTAIVRSSTQIDLSWNELPFDAQNGQIILYNIQVVRNNQTEQTLNTTEQFYSVTNLRKFTNYTFLVSALNQIGEGPVETVTQATQSDCKF